MAIIKKERLIRLPEVMDRTGYRHASIYNLVRERKFPAPIKLAGGRATAWLESEIDNWISGLAAQRDGGAA